MFLNTIFALLLKTVISLAADDFFDLSADDHLGHQVIRIIVDCYILKAPILRFSSPSTPARQCSW